MAKAAHPVGGPNGVLSPEDERILRCARPFMGTLTSARIRMKRLTVWRIKGSQKKIMLTFRSLCVDIENGRMALANQAGTLRKRAGVGRARHRPGQTGYGNERGFEFQSRLSFVPGIFSELPYRAGIRDGTFFWNAAGISYPGLFRYLHYFHTNYVTIIWSKHGLAFAFAGISLLGMVYNPRPGFLHLYLTRCAPRLFHHPADALVVIFRRHPEVLRAARHPGLDTEEPQEVEREGLAVDLESSSRA